MENPSGHLMLRALPKIRRRLLPVRKTFFDGTKLPLVVERSKTTTYSMNYTAFLSPPTSHWVQGSPPRDGVDAARRAGDCSSLDAPTAIPAAIFLASARFDKVDSQAEI
jgi:hypothetical protein